MTSTFPLCMLLLTVAYVINADVGTNEVLPVAEVTMAVTEEPILTPCIDHDPFCANWKRHCHDGTVGHTTRGVCPKSCGVCKDDGDSCFDISSKCDAWGQYCHDGSFGHLAREHCPKTCKVCVRERVIERLEWLFKEELEDLAENL